MAATPMRNAASQAKRLAFSVCEIIWSYISVLRDLPRLPGSIDIGKNQNCHINAGLAPFVRLIGVKRRA